MIPTLLLDLDSLVPDYIASIPIDPMDGAPLRYNRSTLKIYSVGLDFIDDKGVADRPGQMKGKNELVIELEPD